LLALAALACTEAGANGRAAKDLPEPFDHYYGIYLNGIKVGWMRTRMDVGRRVTMKTDLEASVGGMGRVSKVELEESRSYDSSSGRLLELTFSQAAQTGAVRVHGVADGNTKMKLRIEAGASTTEQTVEVNESLDDAMVVDRLARAAKIGSTATSKRFDGSIQKTMNARHEVLAVETRMFGGIEARAVKMQTKYEELGITETAWMDDSGKVLESRVGGFFVARLEPASVAKKLDYQQDLLVSAVVHTPRRLDAPEAVGGLRLRFSGFDESPPPSSSRQKVEADGSGVSLTLTRDAPPRGVALPVDPAGVPPEYLKATAFIQSEDPAVKQAARRAIGDAKDVFTATSRLANYVFRHVRDEYVPSYSNALEALESGRGDCTEHSILFVALARSLGIPARVAVGIAYWPPGDGFGWHAWAEVYAGGGWYSVDPTWNQPIADATHIKLADGGPAEQARIVMLLGRLKVTSMDVL
jgi:transglutaminase/protease-like cytokinesis protein 3